MPPGDLTYGADFFNGSALGYTVYREDLWGDGPFSWEGFAQTTQARAIQKGFDLTGRRILIVGCAYGYMVKALRAAGHLAWGIDVSEYAISQAPPEVSAYVGVADARVESQIRAFKQNVIGLARNTRIDLIVTEDVLPCLTDADAVAMNQACGGQATRVGHRVSTHRVWYLDPETGSQFPGAPFYNSAGRGLDADGLCQLRTLAEWRSLLGGNSNTGPWLWNYQTWEEG